MRELAHARIMRVSGLDIWPSLILERLLFWRKHAKAILNGEPHVVRTFDEWHDELGISPKCYKRAVTVLREKGLIVTEVHPHPYRAGVMRATFFKLTEACFDLLGINPIGTNRKGLKGPVETSLSDLSSYKNMEITGKLQPTPAASDQTQEDDLKGKTLEDVKAMMTAPKKSPAKVGTGADLEALWKAGLVKHHQGTFFGSFTRAHRAFAKQIVEKIPKEEIPRVVEAVLEDWQGFREFVRKNSTTFKVAENPDLLTLLKFTDMAVNFSREKTGQGDAINCKVSGSDLDW